MAKKEIRLVLFFNSDEYGEVTESFAVQGQLEEALEYLADDALEEVKYGSYVRNSEGHLENVQDYETFPEACVCSGIYADTALRDFPLNVNSTLQDLRRFVQWAKLVKIDVSKGADGILENPTLTERERQNLQIIIEVLAARYGSRAVRIAWNTPDLVNEEG